MEKHAPLKEVIFKEKNSRTARETSFDEEYKSFLRSLKLDFKNAFNFLNRVELPKHVLNIRPSVFKRKFFYNVYSTGKTKNRLHCSPKQYSTRYSSKITIQNVVFDRFESEIIVAKCELTFLGEPTKPQRHIILTQIAKFGTEAKTKANDYQAIIEAPVGKNMRR